MSGPKAFRFAFNSGEISPNLWYRTDLARTYSSCRTMFNFLPTAQGSAKSRYGTRQVGLVGYQETAGNAAIIPVRPDSGKPEAASQTPPFLGRTFAFPAGDTNYRVTVAYDLDQTSYRIKVWDQPYGLLVADIASVWTASQIEELNTYHSIDVLYIFSKYVKPYRLERRAGGVWALVAVEMYGGPFQPENTNEAIQCVFNVYEWTTSVSYPIGQYIRYEGDIYKCLLTHTSTTIPPKNLGTQWEYSYLPIGYETSVTISGTGGAFTADDVGRKFRMYMGTDLQRKVRWSSSAADGSVGAYLPVMDSVNIRTTGIWEGEFALQFQFSGSTEWTTMAQYGAQNGDSNYDATTEQVKYGALARCILTNRTSAPSDSGLNIYATAYGDHYIEGTLTQLYGSTVIGMKLEAPCFRVEKTYRFQKGRYGGSSGWPSVGMVYGDRLMLAGSVDSGLSVNGSRVGDWTDFRLGIYDDAAVEYTLDAESRADVVWMVPLRALVIGTTSAEYILDIAGKEARRVAKHGSDLIAPAVSGDSIYFVERGGKRVIQLYHDDVTVSTEGMVGVDTTIMSQHLFRDFRPRRLAWCNIPTPTLMALRTDGAICAFSYDRQNEVMAWSRLAIGYGYAGDIASMPSIGRNTTTGSGNIPKWYGSLIPPYGTALADELMILDRSVNYDRYVGLIVMSASNIHDLDHLEYDVADDSYPRNLVRGVGQDGTYVAYDQIGQPLENVVGDSCFALLASSPTGPVTSTNNNLVIPCSGYDTFYWIPGGQYTAIYDDGVLLTAGVDYTVFTRPRFVRLPYQHEVRGYSGYNVITITIDGSTGTEGVDYIPQINGDYIILSDDDIDSVENDGTSISTSQWYIYKPVNVMVPNASSTTPTNGYVVCGTLYDCALDTNDMVGMVEMGGPGMTTRISEVKMMVVDTVAAEVSTDRSEYYPVEADVAEYVIGSDLQPFTGIRTVPLAGGYNQEMVVTVYKNSKYPATIAGFCVTGEAN